MGCFTVEDFFSLLAFYSLRRSQLYDGKRITGNNSFIINAEMQNAERGVLQTAFTLLFTLYIYLQ